jgi:flagellar biosynthesis GTPase FlhF
LQKLTKNDFYIYSYQKYKMSDDLDDFDKELIDIFRKRFEPVILSENQQETTEEVQQETQESTQDLQEETRQESTQDLQEETRQESTQDLQEETRQESQDQEETREESQDQEETRQESQDQEAQEKKQDLQETQKEETQNLQEEDQETTQEKQNLQEKEPPSCLEYTFLLILFCFGCFIFYIFLPIKMNFDSHKSWITYTDTCCQVIQNVTRCSIANKCKKLLDFWIYFQNSSRDYYECCYWYTKYSEWRVFSTPFCDPSCLCPKTF